MAQTVVVTAVTGPLGRRVCERAAADPDVDRVIAVDRPGSPAGVGSAVIEHHRVDLDDPEMKRLCEGADALVHLGTGPGDVAATRALLDTAAGAGLSTLVMLSSATVYGAWPGSPVPLTEAAPLRPVPALTFAVERAEIERLVTDWRDERAAHRREHDPSGDRPVPTVAVLRPVIPVGDGQRLSLGGSPWPSWAGLRLDDEAPAQFVHVDDVAAAADLARRQRLDGPFNVAPDGWLSAEARRDLQGPSPRLSLPAPVAERIAAIRWRIGLTGVEPGVLPYTMNSWVVANDRLKAAGWTPAHTNEEAFVEADPGGPLARVHPRRRQLLSLAALAAPVVAVAGGGVFLVLRRLRRRR